MLDGSQHLEESFMIAVATHPVENTEPTSPHEAFERMLPVIRRYAGLASRGEPAEQRQDFIAEVCASAFVAFVRLVERDKADLAYPTVLAKYSIRHVRCGRQVGTKLNANDVSSKRAQWSKRITMERLDQQRRGEWMEILIEDRTAGPAELAAIRIDFGDWLTTLS